MQYLTNCGDDRNKGWCVYCGGKYETDDHVPSRIFLDKPYPDNLSILPACLSCNNSFSKDEEYMACFIECVIASSTEENSIQRVKIRKSLKYNANLLNRISSSQEKIGKKIFWKPESKRIEKIILKSARGHMAYELNEPKIEEPSNIWFAPLESLSVDELFCFESPPDNNGIFPEVGSRAMQRLVIETSECFNDWIVVQPGLYRFMIDLNGNFVRIVFREYLASIVDWYD